VTGYRTAIFVIVLCTAMLVGCREKPSPNGPVDEEITGEIYDTGEVQALVPSGWAAFPVPDVFADEPGSVKSSCFHMIKGGERERDIHAKPYIHLERCQPGAQSTEPDPEFFRNVTDVETLYLGSHSWSGYICEDLHGNKRSVVGRMAILWTEDSGIRYEALIRLEFSGQKEKISLEDREVQAILSSVQSSGSEICFK